MVLDVLSESLGFTYNLMNVKSVARLRNPPYGAILNATVEGTADLAYCGLWLPDYAGRMDEVNVITLWDQLCITFMVPEPRVIISWTNILRPFTPATWLSILTVAVLFSVVAFKICRFQITRILKQDLTRRDALSSFILGMIGVTVGVPVPRTNAKYTTTPIRILAMTWSFSCLILISFYTMNLSSFLTVPYFEPRIDELKDLVKNNFSWGMQSQPIMSEMLNLNTKAGRLFAKKFELVENYKEKLKTRKFAVLAMKIDDFFYTLSPDMAPLKQFTEMRVIKQRQTCNYPTMFVPKHLSHTDEFNIKFLRLVESGIVRKIRGDVFRRHKDTIQAITPQIYQVSMEQPWGMSNLRGPFTVLGFGWVLSVLMFAFEKLTSKYWDFEF